MSSLANERRPTKFSEYVGDSGYLQAVIAKNMHPQALWVTGPPGSGKTTIANLYVRATLCRERPPGSHEACGQCDVCLGDNNDNIHQYVVRDATEAKEAFSELAEVAKGAPHTDTDRADKRRVFIIVDEIQNASRQAISTLLNPLEFGPPTTTWILISMDPERLDPVVRAAIESRCVEEQLRSLTPKDIASRLMQAYPISQEVAISLARISEGNFRKAWSKLEFLLAKYEPEQIDDSLVVGRAHGAARKQLLGALAARDVSSVRAIVDSWQNLDYAGRLLIEDIYEETDGNGGALALLASLCRWSNSKWKLPLGAVLLPHLGVRIREEQ